MENTFFVKLQRKQFSWKQQQCFFFFFLPIYTTNNTLDSASVHPFFFCLKRSRADAVEMESIFFAEQITLGASRDQNSLSWMGVLIPHGSPPPLKSDDEF